MRAVSKLSWATGGAYGLSGGAADARVHRARARTSRSRAPPNYRCSTARSPSSTSRWAISARDNMEVAFKGKVEPISMPLLAKAFGWPEFSGKLAASIPGVTLKDNVLTFQGNVESAGVRRTHRRAATSGCRIRSATSRSSSPTCARAISISAWSRRHVRSRQHHRQARGRRARPRVVRLVADGVRRAARHAEGRQIAASHQREGGEQPVERRRRRRRRGAGAAIRRAASSSTNTATTSSASPASCAATSARCRASSPRASATTSSRARAFRASTSSATPGRVSWSQLLSSIPTADIRAARPVPVSADGLRPFSGQ